LCHDFSTSLWYDFTGWLPFDVTSQLEKINVPTLIICGAKDQMMPLKFSVSLRNGIANSQLHVLDNAGHMVMLEQPDAVADLLKQFIDTIPLKVKRVTKKRIPANGVADPVP
jgi:pimeloyl-ACP methyl ester carboxylesterase